MSTRSADVVIVGGGTAGIAAAIAAARNGAKTLIVDKNGFLGGTATAGNVFHGFFDCRGRQVVKGIAHEVIQRMVDEGGSLGHLCGGKWGPDTPPDFVYCQTPYDLEAFKYVALKLVEEAGVEMLLHTFFAGAAVENGRLRRIRIVNKSGLSEIEAGVLVDCSGDADVAAAAGVPFEFGRGDGLAQNVTLLFTVAGVDFDRVVEYSKQNVRIRTWGEWHSRGMRGRKLGEEQESWVSLSGKINVEPDPSDGKFLSCGFRSLRPGELRLNVTRTVGIDATRAEDLTRAEVEERKNVFEIVKKLQRFVPGFEKAYLHSTAVEVGIRESRRILGEYQLTAEDVLEGRSFEDGIAKGAYTMDIHDPKGGHVVHTFIKDGGSYDIPYRCLTPLRVDGLLVAGRCISATHDALGSTRQMPTCMALGEAAGTAAALSAGGGVDPRRVDTRLLRETLLRQGASV